MLSSAKFKKPWFNNKCLISRNKYRNAKNKYNSNKSTYNLATMTNLGKQYKKQLKVSRKNYCHNLNLKLCTCKLNNPKEYWKLLDIKHKNNEIKANFSDLVDHFNLRILITLRIPNHNLSHDNPLNDNFTLDEINKAIKKLKRNKSCGINGIDENMKIGICCC